MPKLHIEIHPSETDASFRLFVQVRGAKGEPLATIGTLDQTQDLLPQIKLMQQAFRMGQRLGE